MAVKVTFFSGYVIQSRNPKQLLCFHYETYFKASRQSSLFTSYNFRQCVYLYLRLETPFKFIWQAIKKILFINPCFKELVQAKCSTWSYYRLYSAKNRTRPISWLHNVLKQAWWVGFCQGHTANQSFSLWESQQQQTHTKYFKDSVSSVSAGWRMCRDH